MKKIFSLFILSATLFAGLYCKKSNSPGNNNSNNGNDTTSPSAVGVPIGSSISKYISSAGGSIATSDGRVAIDIPSGALPNGDTITIQNITNSAETGIGDAYRFLPNGLKFASPVTIKFHYTDDDINGSAPEFLGIAYQDSAGFWKPINVNDPDTVAHIISGQTNHFTDFTEHVYGSLLPIPGYLMPGHKLEINKFVIFQVTYAKDKNVGAYTVFLKKFLLHPNDANYAVNDIEGGDAANGFAVGATQANSGVTGYAITEGVAVKYTAPAKIPDINPVTLTVAIEGYIPIYDSNGNLTDKTKYVKGTFRQKIKIIANVYRLDFVDWEDLGSGGTVNYYDSASLFFNLDQADPTKTVNVKLSTDSIQNFPPVAWPTTPTKGAGNCTYTWIPEPIGTVNITGGKFLIYPVAISNTTSQYAVLMQLNNTNINGAWEKVNCGPGTGTETKTPTNPDQTISIPPFTIDKNSTDTTTYLIVGSFDKDHISWTLIKGK